MKQTILLLFWRLFVLLLCTRVLSPLFPIKAHIRSYFRLLVLCFVWAFLHFVGTLWHLCPCSDVAAQGFPVYCKRSLSCCLGFLFFPSWFPWTQEVASLLSLAPSLSVCLWRLFLSLLISFTVWWRVVRPPELSPLSPLPSTVNKQPEPAPRRASTVNRKQPQLTSPTFQPPLPPLEAWGPSQSEHQPQAPSPAPEADQPALSGAGSAGGACVGGGGVQVASVHPQVVTQLGTEESR